LQYVGNGPEEGWGERERGKGTIGALIPFANPLLRGLPKDVPHRAGGPPKTHYRSF